jgi:hypothetical protein
MNNKTLPLAFLFMSAFMVQHPANSMDRVGDVVAAFQDGVVEAPRGLTSSQKAGNVLRKLARDKGYVLGWDDKKDRIMYIQQVGDTIAPYDQNFLEKRETLSIEASLLAKASIIESFLTTASAENLLKVPGNPIAKQLEQEQKQLKQMQARAQKFYDEAQRETSVLVPAYQQAQADDLQGVTYGDRVNSLLEGVIKKLDKEWSSQQITDEKKQRLENIKLRLSKAQEIEEKERDLLEKIKNKTEQLQGAIKKEVRSKIETNSSMPLFGAITLMQIESYDELRETFELASLVAWSPKLEKQARDILLGSGKGKPRKNKISRDAWLDKQNLASMSGARRYLESDGSINYMGVSAVSYDPDDPGSYSMLQVEAELWAKQAAILSLKAAVESQKSAERLTRTIQVDGKTETEVLKDMSVEISESVKGLNISGLQILRVEETVYPPTGQTIIVAVAGVNSALAVKARGIMADTYATLKEVNADQSFVKGEVAGMKAEAAKTENNAEIYNDGVVSGSQSVDQEYDKRESDRAAIRQAKSGNDQEPAVGGSSAEQVKSDGDSGTWAGDFEVDDDF